MDSYLVLYWKENLLPVMTPAKALGQFNWYGITLLYGLVMAYRLLKSIDLLCFIQLCTVRPTRSAPRILYNTSLSRTEPEWFKMRS